jgi:hypothetical protein
MQKRITIKQINEILKYHGFAHLTAGKPSMLSPFVLVKGADLWNKRLGEFDTIKELKAFVEGYIKIN